ncbi:MAG: PA2169 family four-helix-bundle protein [Sphingomonas sp.]|nr:PA2169 family four-helix-bundle protein [Sphingomonas sp.]
MASTFFKSLVDTTYDSIEGYKKVIEKASDPHLKSELEKLLANRNDTLTQLNAELQKQGDELVTKGTATGALHRAWIDIVGLFENGDENAAERLSEGESFLASKFEEALESGVMSTSEEEVVKSALVNIRASEQIAKSLVLEHD